MKALGREPALILAVFSAAVQMIVGFGFHLSTDQVADINAAAAALAGLVTAALVARNQLVPAILGLLQAGLTLGMVFGFHLAATEVTTIMAFAAAVAAAFSRTQVTAVVSEEGMFVERVALYGPRRPPRAA